MLIDRSRQKMLEAIIFFARNTKDCGKTKLIKLLYLLDFEHFRETGRSVTGLDYYAWKMGPVPIQLYNELEDPKEDFRASIGLTCKKKIDYPTLMVEPKRDFDASVFSRRELKVMERLASEHHAKTAAEMVEVTHGENHAWARIWREGEGNNALIPYEVALRDVEEEFHRVSEMASARSEIQANYA